MATPATLFPGVFGPGRQARWRRLVARRVLAALAAAAAVTGAVLTLRPPVILPATAPVLVASRDLAAGSVLAADAVRVVALTADGSPPGAYAAPGPVLGRMLAAPVAAGEPLTPTRLVPRGPPEGLADGLVAVHVPVDDEATLALLSGGMRVRLHALDGSALARAVLVLAVDPVTDAEGGEGRTGRRGMVVAVGDEDLGKVLGALTGPAGSSALQVAIEPARAG